jgi:hypothetical protein
LPEAAIEPREYHHFDPKTPNYAMVETTRPCAIR